MRILVIGAGPAGLSFALLMAQADPTHDITLAEKNGKGILPGFGVTLRNEGASFLQLGSGLPVHHLEGRAFRYRGKLIVDLPNPRSAHLVTLSRALLVSALIKRCEERGVRLRFDCDAGRLRESDLEDFELVVAADGAQSAVRRLYEHAFAPLVQSARNCYGWFGANVPLPKLTIMLADAEGALLAWGYKYTPSMSTLIVECSDTTIRRLGLNRMSPVETASTIGKFFAPDLGGAMVDCGNVARWTRFTTVTCRRLYHNKVVLIGDAAHTTHFSQGFGTMFAFDDAMTLQSAFATTSDVEAALGAYETAQLQKIATFQELARRSMEWSERIIEMAEASKQSRVLDVIAERWPKNDAPPWPGGN